MKFLLVPVAVSLQVLSQRAELLFTPGQFEFIALLLELVNLLSQDFNVQLQLLLNLDMVAHFGLIQLQLSFVLLGCKVQRLEGRREVGRCAFSVSGKAVAPATLLLFLLLFGLHVHQNFDRAANVLEHCAAV